MVAEKKLLIILKPLLFIFIALFISSCEKQYSCSCSNVNTNKDTILDVVKTTKLGSKGFHKTCVEHTNIDFKNCHLK